MSVCRRGMKIAVFDGDGHYVGGCLVFFCVHRLQTDSLRRAARHPDGASPASHFRISPRDRSDRSINSRPCELALIPQPTLPARSSRIQWGDCVSWKAHTWQHVVHQACHGLYAEARFRSHSVRISAIRSRQVPRRRGPDTACERSAAGPLVVSGFFRSAYKKFDMRACDFLASQWFRATGSEFAGIILPASTARSRQRRHALVSRGLRSVAESRRQFWRADAAAGSPKVEATPQAAQSDIAQPGRTGRNRPAPQLDRRNKLAQRHVRRRVFLRWPVKSVVHSPSAMRTRAFAGTNAALATIGCLSDVSVLSG